MHILAYSVFNPDYAMPVCMREYSQTTDPAITEVCCMCAHTLLSGIRLIGTPVRSRVPSIHYTNHARGHHAPKNICIFLPTITSNNYEKSQSLVLTYLPLELTSRSQQPPTPELLPPCKCPESWSSYRWETWSHTHHIHCERSSHWVYET